MIRVTRVFLPIVSGLSAAGVALADPPAPPANPAPVPQTVATVSPMTVKPNHADKVICKYDTPTGSRLGGHRTCMKKSDWDAQAAASQAVMSQRIGSGTSSH